MACAMDKAQSSTSMRTNTSALSTTLNISLSQRVTDLTLTSRDAKNCLNSLKRETAVRVGEMMVMTLVAKVAMVAEAMVVEAAVAEALVVAAEEATMEAAMTATEVETTTEVVVEVIAVSVMEAAATKIVTVIPVTITGAVIKAPQMAPGEQAPDKTTREALTRRRQDVAAGCHAEVIRRHQMDALALTRRLNRTQTKTIAPASEAIVEATGSEVVAVAEALTNHQALLPTRKQPPCT